MILRLREARAGLLVRVGVEVLADEHAEPSSRGWLRLDAEDWAWLLAVLTKAMPASIQRMPCELCAHPAHTGGLCHAETTSPASPEHGPGAIKGCPCDDWNPTAVLLFDIGAEQAGDPR